MSSELELTALGAPTFDPDSLPPMAAVAADRVLETAGDRPDADSLPPLADPLADHADVALIARRKDVDEKHRRVIGMLKANGYDGVLLGRADSVAWLTCGGDLSSDLASEGASALIYVNKTTRAVITDNVQSPRIFEEELAGLGFTLKERPWHEDSRRVLAELCHGKRIAADLGCPSLAFEADRIRALRRPLTSLERQRLRELGRSLTLAVEATARNFLPGETEADVAGHLAHRLLREGIVPVDLRVAGDGRLARYRQPTFKSFQIQQVATITATGRRHGMCASVSRTVSFGKVDPEHRAAHSVAAMVDATFIFFSRPGRTVAEVYQRARRIYQKFRFPHEWTLDYQGNLIGYAPREEPLLPESGMPLPNHTAISWSPSVGPARSSDTVAIDGRGFEVVTEAQNWPKLDVQVKGFNIPRPGILER